MSEIGTERVEPMAQVVERAGDDGSRERGPRPRRRPPTTIPADRNPESADHAEIPLHQVDSLA